MPTLLLLGADTRLYDPEEVSARALRLLPDATVEVIPNAGHGLLFQHPERIATRVLEFIAEREPPT